jgi:DNA-binding MurR/RpiR family transcriptional regulator
MAKDKTTPVPIRIEPELDAKIEEAARLTGLSKADVMRLAMRIGFEDLRKIDYDLAGIISAAANPEPARQQVRYPQARDLRAMPPATLNEEAKTRPAK